jgi:hypothetical protein
MKIDIDLKKKVLLHWGLDLLIKTFLFDMNIATKIK